MDTIKVARFIELDAQKKSLEHQIEVIKEEMDGLNAELVEEFAHEGIQSFKANGKTAYLRRDIYGRLDSEEAIKIISEMEDWSWMIRETVNSQTLSAKVRELERDEETDMPILPPVLEGHVKVSEIYNIRVRRA